MADECPTPKMRCGQNEIAKSSFRFLMAKLQLKIVRLLCQIVINTTPVTPEQGNPLDLYGPSDLDETNPVTQYYGFLRPNEDYVIEELTSTSVRYYTGSGLANYITDWGNRAGLSYQYLSDAF